MDGFGGVKWEIWNGRTTLFWEDVWCGDCSLKAKFPRLFRLATLKNGRVDEYTADGGFRGVEWKKYFSRELLDKEKLMLMSLVEVVEKFSLSKEKEDRLIWLHDKKGEFLVKKMSELLIENDSVEVDFDFGKI